MIPPTSRCESGTCLVVTVVPRGVILSSSRRPAERIFLDADELPVPAETLALLARRPSPVADPPPTPGGCPVTVWDGPYSYRCGQGGGGNVCARHGSFAPEADRG